MGERFLNVGGLLCVAAAAAALLLAVGCGSSSDPEVTVQPGSLSKAEFVKKAGAICESARNEFIAKYVSFIRSHESALGDKQTELALLGEVVESLLAPSVEGQIEEISKLGSPRAYAPKVASFLNAAQNRLAEMQDDPSQLTKTPTPFKEVEDTAAKVGMHGCSESFS